MDPDAALIRLAVFGSPVKHSLSPRTHALFAQQAGLSVDYRAIETSEEFLSRDLQALADKGARGCNITLPLKLKAYDLASLATERAQLAGAANTLVFESPSRWNADITDGVGLVRDLTVQHGMPLQGLKIAIIGAGGAAAGILGDLLNEKPGVICILNRSEQRAKELAERFSGLGEVQHMALADVAAAGEFDLVINATSLAHHSGRALQVRNLFAPGSLYYDLNYGQAHKGLANWAESNRIRCVDGLGMLVEQAAESFYLWTGFQANTDPVIEALRAGK